MPFNKCLSMKGYDSLETDALHEDSYTDYGNRESVKSSDGTERYTGYVKF
jgi:hypothetical protein